MPDRPLHLYRFMDKIAHPLGFAPVEKADFAIGIPAAMQNPAAQILRQRGTV